MASDKFKDIPMPCLAMGCGKAGLIAVTASDFVQNGHKNQLQHLVDQLKELYETFSK